LNKPRRLRVYAVGAVSPKKEEETMKRWVKGGTLLTAAVAVLLMTQSSGFARHKVVTYAEDNPAAYAQSYQSGYGDGYAYGYTGPAPAYATSAPPPPPPELPPRPPAPTVYYGPPAYYYYTPPPYVYYYGPPVYVAPRIYCGPRFFGGFHGVVRFPVFHHHGGRVWFGLGW
jgi:hypothetical protein